MAHCLNSATTDMASFFLTRQPLHKHRQRNEYSSDLNLDETPKHHKLNAMANDVYFSIVQSENSRGE